MSLDKRLLADAVRRSYNTERVFDDSVEGFAESVAVEYDRLAKVEAAYDREAEWVEPPSPTLWEGLPKTRHEEPPKASFGARLLAYQMVPNDQEFWLGDPPWAGEELQKWELIHGHDARTDCDLYNGCRVSIQAHEIAAAGLEEALELLYDASGVTAEYDRLHKVVLRVNGERP